MNKQDFILIFIVLVVAISIYFIFKKDNNYAYVYYDKNLVLKVDLSIDEEYKINGYNGELLLEVKEKKIRVKNENSNYHLCSKQGFTNTGSVVCLPNKVVINFENDELDSRIG